VAGMRAEAAAMIPAARARARKRRG